MKRLLIIVTTVRYNSTWVKLSVDYNKKKLHKLICELGVIYRVNLDVGPGYARWTETQLYVSVVQFKGTRWMP